MNKSKKILVIILSILGLITSIKLTMIYIDVNFNPYALPSFCSVSDYIDCDGVAKTEFSQFLGIPLAIWGLCLYLFVLFLCCVEYLKKMKYLGFLKVFKNPFSYIYSLSILAFIISMSLACLSIFEIKKVCVLCFVTYFIDLAIALVSRAWGKGLIYDFKISIQDFIEGIKVKKYAISLAILIIIASIFLTFTTVSHVLTPQVKRFESIKFFKNMKENPYKVKGNTLGDENAKIIIHEYIDYNCPSCYISNIMLHRVVTELAGIRIIQHQLPLDKTCNPYVQVQVHDNSCIMSRYALAAKRQGKFWDMNEMLFEATPHSEEEIIKQARRLKLNTAKLYEDANSKEVQEELLKDIELSKNENIIGTPTIIINMTKHIGTMPYYELREKLLKMGATERK